MPLRKPATIGATANPPAASEIRYATGAAFPIKVWRVTGNHGPHSVDEVTGDLDANASFEHNQLHKGQYVIEGAMLADGELGIENLNAASGSDSGNPVTFKLFFSSGTTAGTSQTVTLLVTNLQYVWFRRGVFVPVRITGIVTDTTPSAIESTS